jgi:hypothetical protein
MEPHDPGDALTTEWHTRVVNGCEWTVAVTLAPGLSDDDRRAEILMAVAEQCGRHWGPGRLRRTAAGLVWETWQSPERKTA